MSVTSLPASDQSTNHILLIEPAVFYANPETMDSNVYQHQSDENADAVFKKAHAEFINFQQMLMRNGVAVTTVRGDTDCPDHIFPNWISTHKLENNASGIIIYPMLNENRRRERSSQMVQFFQRHYQTYLDMSVYENKGLSLEANGSLCLDRVHKIAYATRSSRTDETLAQQWAKTTGYELVLFDTRSHNGQDYLDKPVYHTDLVMWIGTTVAALCAEAITPENRQQVHDKLSKTHIVCELTPQQMAHFCGNALEVQNLDGEKFLVMSSTAYGALTKNQTDLLSQHTHKLLHCPIPTIEQHGGGSARCLMMELF